MLNLNSLYSLNGNIPQFLPHRIRLSDGRIRTDRESFTLEEIIDAGYKEAPEKPQFRTDQVLKWNGSYWEIHDMDESEIQKLWQSIRAERDKRIEDLEWRISRYMSEERRGVEHIDDINELDAYIQELRDITKQPDPFSIEWPSLSDSDT